MIPVFPKFTKVSKKESQEVAQFTSDFPPYSDFNFASIYSWNLDGQSFLSYLNCNLVLKMKSYVGKNTIYSFIGENKVDDTVLRLLNLNDCHSLQLVPELVVKNFRNPDRFTFREDKDSQDCILSLGKISGLSGRKLKSKRHANNKAKRVYRSIVLSELALQNLSSRRAINKMLKSWMQKKINKDQKLRTGLLELKQAINRMLGLSGHCDLIGLGLYLDSELASYFIAECVNDGYVIGHYMTGDTSFPFVYDILYHEVGKYFHKLGYKYLNLEQDLGVPYLVKAKKSWDPTHYLKKYNVSEA